MYSDIVLRMVADLFWTGLLLCSPVLCATMLVGLIVSVLQVVTQVQEMTLTFVPKLIVTALVLVVCGPWMLRTLSGYMSRLWTQIPLIV